MRIRKLTDRAAALCLLLLMLLGLCPFAAAETAPAGEAEAEESAAAAEEEAAPDDWETRLLLMLQEHSANPETIGAGYLNLATGEEHYYNGDQYRISGSMYKVPLNMLFLNWIDEGKLALDDLIGGYRYSQLLEGTIIDSNNDYARMLWDYAGATIETNPSSTYYHRYRILIAPLMGEDPDNVDDKYYENNFFTPRQVIHCLRELYNGGEKYDRLIETMQRAEPEKYFKLRERRFNIAHKYGWYAEDPVLYLNDCGLCFTDDPIAIVLFTSGTENAYGVLTDFCTLMCNYAQEKHEERIQREQEEAEAAALAAEQDRLAREAAAAAEPSPTGAPAPSAPPTAKPEETPEPRRDSLQLDLGQIVALTAVMLGVLAAMIWFFVRHRNSRMNLWYGLLSVLLTGAALLLCFPGVDGRSYISVPEETATDTVTAFFEALKSGDYAAADSCLASGAKLGLADAVPEGVQGRALRALEESWDYTMIGETSTVKASGWQEVRIRVLSFAAMERDMQRETRSQLLGLSRTMGQGEIFDEAGNYRPEVASEAYDRAMESLLGQAGNYYGTATVRVRLKLTEDGWKIVLTRELLSALSGNPG